MRVNFIFLTQIKSIYENGHPLKVYSKSGIKLVVKLNFSFLLSERNEMLV